MGSRVIRFLYDRRAWLKPLLPVRRPIPVRTAEGFTIYVRLQDWAVGARIAVRRRYEPHVAAVLRDRLRPGAVMVDVGANIGYHTLLAATAVGQEGRVHAFEPGGENLSLLRRSLEANGLRNVTVHPCAAADVDGTLGFRMDDSNGRIEAPGEESLARVPAVRLDARLADQPRIDLVKMDVEGAEGRVLRGMRELVARHRPAIVTEFTPAAMPAISDMPAEEFLALLREPAYDLFVIHRDRPLDPGPQTDGEILSMVRDTPRLDYLDLLAAPR